MVRFSEASLHDLDLKQLEAVAEICRAGSFSAAARELRISQPSLSKSIARLERQLGLRLFDRSGVTVQPTVYGRLIAERGQGLLGSAAALRQELHRLANGIGGSLRLAVGPATRLKPLPDLVRELLVRFPDLQLETLHEGGLEIMRGVDEGRHDIVFGYFENAAPYGDLMRVKIFEDRQVCVVSPDHPVLEAEAPLGPRELLRHPIASAGVTREFQRWVGRMSVEERRLAYAFVSDDFSLIRQAVKGAGFIARGPHFVFQEDLASGAMVELPTTWSAIYECWMLTTQTHWQSPVVKAVAEIAKRVSELGAPGGSPPA
jgi:DNA-binding transcriptional LysR family regulator